MAPSSTPPNACGYESGMLLTSDGLGISIHVDGLDAAALRTLAGALLHKADQLTPASPASLHALELPLRVVNEAHGTGWTVEALAAECNVDLREATVADVGAMAGFIGGTIMGARQ